MHWHILDAFACGILGTGSTGALWGIVSCYFSPSECRGWENLSYPDQASSVPELTLTLKDPLIRSPNTTERQAISYSLFADRELWRVSGWLAWLRSPGESVSRSSKNSPVPWVWIQSIAFWLKSYIDDRWARYVAQGSENRKPWSLWGDLFSCIMPHSLCGAAESPPPRQAGAEHIPQLWPDCCVVLLGDKLVAAPGCLFFIWAIIQRIILIT